MVRGGGERKKLARITAYLSVLCSEISVFGEQGSPTLIRTAFEMHFLSVPGPSKELAYCVFRKGVICVSP